MRLFILSNIRINHLCLKNSVNDNRKFKVVCKINNGRKKPLDVLNLGIYSEKH